jgi:EmrB/QacA subfamily drug resistance transporter
MPATLSIITNVFTDHAERRRAIALWAAMAGVGGAVGPVVGGWLLERFWYGSVFLINVPVVAIALLAIAALVPTSRDPQQSRLDPIGAVLSILGMASLVYAIIEGGDGWMQPVVLGGFTVAATLMALFVLWERRVAVPMLPISFFANPRFTAAVAALSLVFFAFLGTIFLATQYLQFVQAYSALAAGIRLLPLAAGVMLAAPLSAHLDQRVGTKAVVAGGLMVAATGLVWASFLTVGTPYGVVAVALVVLGLGVGVTMPPATDSIMGSVPPAKAGVGSAVNDATRQLGGALGVAMLGSVFSSVYAGTLRSALADQPIPAATVDAAAQQIGAALGAAPRIGGQQGAELADVARQAFVDGFGISALAGAGAALLCAGMVVVGRPVTRADDPASAAKALLDELG